MDGFEYTNYVQAALPWNKLISIASGGKCYGGVSEACIQAHCSLFAYYI